MSQLQTKPPSSSWVLVRRLLRDYLRPHLRLLFWALLFMLLAAAMTGALAKLMEPVIDQVFAAQNREQLWLVAAMVLGAFTLRGFATYGHALVVNSMGQRIVATIQSQLYGHLLHADLAFFHAHAAGQLQSRLINDVGVMRQAVAECLTSMGKSTLTLIFLVGVMFYQDWLLASAAFVVFPLAAFYVAKMGKKLRRNANHIQQEVGNLTARLTESFQSVRHIKAFGGEAYEQQRTGKLIQHITALAMKGFRISALLNPVSEILSGIAIVTVIVYGGLQVMEGVRTPGALFSFITAFLLAYEPMKRLAKVNAQLQAGLASAERVFAVLDLPAQIVDAPQAQQLHLTDASITLRNVDFCYADGTKALSAVNITVPAGKMVALVGASGAGKSTILNLIPRFFDVSAGEVLLGQKDGGQQDGGQKDIRTVTLSSLRAAMALVSQEVAMFDDSIRANIAYGKFTASEDEIIAAAKAAQAHDFIIQLPQAYDTIVGEFGVRLSGGQRQRIAIARAILRNAPILLLDEATSALDNDSERAVQAALKALRAQRTTLVVAHRLSSIIDSDWIYVLENGAVIEQGTHNSLLQQHGLYARLYGQEQQAGAA